jgi:hypothetical protein
MPPTLPMQYLAIYFVLDTSKTMHTCNCLHQQDIGGGQQNVLKPNPCKYLHLLLW